MWQEFTKVLMLLFISIGIITVVILMNTGKYQDNMQISKEIGYIFGFNLIIFIAIIFTNYLLIHSSPNMKLNIEWGLIYASLILSFVSMSYIHMWSFGGSIASGAVNNVIKTGSGTSTAGAQTGTSCCGKCC